MAAVQQPEVPTMPNKKKRKIIDDNDSDNGDKIEQTLPAATKNVEIDETPVTTKNVIDCKQCCKDTVEVISNICPVCDQKVTKTVVEYHKQIDDNKDCAVRN